MQVILSWLPEAQRPNYTNPAGTAELARWLLKWKLFSDVAKKNGFTDKKQVKDIMDWALKVESAAEYINKELVPKAKSKVVIDTAMCQYVYLDESGDVNRKDVAGVNSVVDRYVSKAIKTNLNSLLYDIRKHHKVVFLKPDPSTSIDYKDELAGNPVSMIAKADSLRDAGNTGEAEALYEPLVKNYPFTEQGLKAYPELAKIKTEKGESSDAIKLYRDYMIANGDKGIRCNTFFMIGFIYDEYLNRSALAEINYKWVLKNTPECELADDAEFMTLHLDEPMSSVEELRAEAMRQGKKVDTTSVAEAPVETKAPAKK
jgi:tetratricopeptide (TPR) repeat protein